MAVLSALRIHLTGLVLWTAFAVLVIAVGDLLIRSRVRWPANVGAVVGCGIGLYVASRVVPFPSGQ